MRRWSLVGAAAGTAGFVFVTHQLEVASWPGAGRAVVAFFAALAWCAILVAAVEALGAVRRQPMTLGLMGLAAIVLAETMVFLER